MKEGKAYIGDEIVEGNKLIAEFLQLSKCTDNEHKDDPCFYAGGTYQKAIELKYHLSWNWLMSVVDKIEGLGIADIEYNSFKKGGSQILISVNGILIIGIMHDHGQALEAYWQAVVQFITWYNQNKQ